MTPKQETPAQNELHIHTSRPLNPHLEQFVVFDVHEFEHGFYMFFPEEEFDTFLSRMIRASATNKEMAPVLFLYTRFVVAHTEPVVEVLNNEIIWRPQRYDSYEQANLQMYSICNSEDKEPIYLMTDEPIQLEDNHPIFEQLPTLLKYAFSIIGKGTPVRGPYEAILFSKKIDAD